MSKPKADDFLMCICGHERRDHDLERCDHRCTYCGCEHFQRSAVQPGPSPLRHHAAHGPKPGKGLPPLIPADADPHPQPKPRQPDPFASKKQETLF